MDGVLVVRDATPEPTLCYTIQPGDTASNVALRFTGSVQHRYEPWFQIMDPGVHRLIPKAQYGRIHPGWRACVPETRLTAGWRPSIGVPAVPIAAAASTGLAATDPSIVLGSGAALLAVLLISWRPACAHLKRARATTHVMQVFAERFISEFERPLKQPGSAERPLQARVRLARRRRRVDILLAPNGGRSYPNLADHRKNVTYDIGRVVRLIADTRFTTGPVYARGHWVVVPCRLLAQPRLEGGR